jgi:hypothetical protein
VSTCYVGQKAQGIEGMLKPAAVTLGSKEEIISHWLHQLWTWTCVPSPQTQESAGLEGFSVAKSMPRAQMLVDGKAIDFS